MSAQPRISRLIFFSLVIILSWFAFGSVKAGSPPQRIKDFFAPADASQVHLNGWLGRYVDGAKADFVLHKDIVPTYMRPLEKRDDLFWQAEHIGKWLDAAGTQWKYTGDAQLRPLMGEAVERMVAAQEPNGWLGSYTEPLRYYQVNWNACPGPSSWDDNRHGWDLWCNFMSLEGLLKYHDAFPDSAKALTAAEHLGDLITHTFGPQKQDITLVPHDNGIGAMTTLLGVAQLYEVTGKAEYLDYCRYVVNQFGRSNSTPFIMAGTRGAAGDRFPFASDGAVLKHAESELILRGLCELYRMTGEEVYLQTCRNVYDAGYAPLLRTMCLSGYASPKTGLAVPRTVREEVETCDIPPMLRWWVEMFRLTGEVRYLNAVEREVYNQLLCHRTPKGQVFANMPSTHFRNPSGTSRRYSALDPFNCCWSMGPVGLSDLPLWTYFTSPNGVLINFYEPSTFTGEVGGVAAKLTVSTEYPVEGVIEIRVEPQKPTRFNLQLRIPDWCSDAAIMVNGRRWKERPRPGSILAINREWQAGDRVTLDLPMRARVSEPMDGAAGYEIIERGPLLLAMTERFNRLGDGWCYATPEGPPANLRLKRIALSDPAGQTSVGWEMRVESRLDDGRKISRTTTPATLVAFSDAGIHNEPYVAAFPTRKMIESLPPRLAANHGQALPVAAVLADSEGTGGGTNVIDGKIDSFWRSAESHYPHWIEARLSKRQNIGRVVVHFGERRNHPVNFRIFALDRGAARPIVEVKDCQLSDYYWAAFKPVNAEAVRLLIESSSGESPAASVAEIELFSN